MNGPKGLFGFAVLTCCATSVCGEVNFNREIRPLLSANCFQCHGPDEDQREADLRLDVEQLAKSVAITPGDLNSELLLRVSSTDPELVMPPPDSGKQLSTHQIELLRTWIKQGAPWSEHWAYVPPRKHAVPAVHAAWPQSWIDDFILDRLQQGGLVPAPDADKVTLLRRLYFDLTGLPPSWQEVQDFLHDRREEAYEAVVDRLLESPHFGERLAIYWLDLVRYADTVGYHGDQDQNISPYRDYVIEAFNQNLPFDQFTREQLAGDLLESPTVDQRIATGYNRLLQTSHEGGVQPKEYIAIYQADRVRNISAVWLGGTLGCAQCHHHKYDPYTSKDFYSMAAFFADIDEEQHFKIGTNSLPTARPPEIDVLNWKDRRQYHQVQQQIEQLQQDPSTDSADQLDVLRKKARQYKKRQRRTMVTVALETPRTVRILPRGDWLDDSGPVVQPAVPEFLGMLNTPDRATRLDLAGWLIDSQEGIGLLTARVMANRFWYLMFGAGLTQSLDDFGAQGTPPMHPELLDNLAIEFVASGWDIKQFFKLLAMTRTYRQASVTSQPQLQRDPNNLLFARQSRHRLPAEMIRDMALVVSGLLVDENGGASIRPYQPAGYYRHLNFPRRRYAHHGDQRQWRRGVYVHWQRQFLHPMLKAFDAPTREECTTHRPRSNTPLAALVLLNDPTFVEAARALACRLLAEATSDSQRIRRAYEIVLSRPPSETEDQALQSLLNTSRQEFENNTDGAVSFLEVGETETELTEPVEMAAWTTVCRAVLNLSEANTRQ